MPGVRQIKIEAFEGLEGGGSYKELLETGDLVAKKGQEDETLCKQIKEQKRETKDLRHGVR